MLPTVRCYVPTALAVIYQRNKGKKKTTLFSTYNSHLNLSHKSGNRLDAVGEIERRMEKMVCHLKRD